MQVRLCRVFLSLLAACRSVSRHTSHASPSQVACENAKTAALLLHGDPSMFKMTKQDTSLAHGAGTKMNHAILYSLSTPYILSLVHNPCTSPVPLLPHAHPTLPPRSTKHRLRRHRMREMRHKEKAVDAHNARSSRGQKREKRRCSKQARQQCQEQGKIKRPSCIQRE